MNTHYPDRFISLRKRLARLSQLLLEPAKRLQDKELRRKAALLSAFLLIMIVIFTGVDLVFILTIPSYAVPWYGYIFLLTSYGLNRNGYYKIAASLAIAMFPIVVFSSLANGQGPEPLVMLNYLILSLIAGSILFSMRGLVLLAFANILGIFLIPFYAPEYFPDFSSIVGPLSAMAIGAALVLVSMWHRNIIERDRQAELRRSEERLRLALDAASMGTWEWDIQNGNVEWSDGVEAIFGLRSGEFEGTYDAYLSLLPDEDKKRVEAEISHALQDPNANYQTVHRIFLADQSVRWIEGKGRVYRGEGDRAFRMIGTVADVTMRRQAEEDREKLIGELEIKNAELEEFAYMVSHDLKSPIITIKGFLGYLREDAMFGNTIRLESDIQRISDATEKMHRLLNDLLELSRIGRLMNPPEQVSFNSLVQDAIELLHGQIRTHGVSLHVDDNLPSVYGDRQRLLEVLQNLIDNATKFMGDQPEPRIEIGQQGKAENGMPVYYVCDNGIGISPQFNERIFGLFNKLDARTEGTGVGLALVKRIIEFHGGRIWVESEAGRGATFFFTLPASGTPPSQPHLRGDL